MAGVGEAGEGAVQGGRHGPIAPTGQWTHPTFDDAMRSTAWEGSRQWMSETASERASPREGSLARKRDPECGRDDL